MSVQPRTRRLTTGDIVALKRQRPIVALTAYTAPMATLIDSHVDVILVGDSLGNVIYGFDTTLPVTLEMMIAHGAAVVRGSASALVVVDLPFGSYQASPQQAFDASARVLAETGATAVKLEGGEEMAATVAFLTRRGVPVMGHIGLTPQSVHTLGGFRIQGRDEAGAARLTRDARAIEEAGAFSIVLEGVIADLVEDVVGAAQVPIIGIGASASCDGQVLVIDDMLGLNPARAPKFVKRYGEFWRDVESAVTAYAGEVRARQFPSEDHLYRTRK